MGIRIFLLSALLTGFSWPAFPAINADRGQQLYETFCTECHTSRIHVQERQKVKSFESLKATVRIRALEFSNLNWSEEEILDVTHYLNEKYYHFSY